MIRIGITYKKITQQYERLNNEGTWFWYSEIMEEKLWLIRKLKYLKCQNIDVFLTNNWAILSIPGRRTLSSIDNLCIARWLRFDKIKNIRKLFSNTTIYQNLAKNTTLLTKLFRTHNDWITSLIHRVLDVYVSLLKMSCHFNNKTKSGVHFCYSSF